MLVDFIGLTVSGLLSASLIALGAVGFTLTFGIARFPNIAHPEFMMVGTYTTYAFNVGLGLPFWLAAILGVTVAVPICVLVARTAFDKLPVRGHVQFLLVAIGVSILLRSVVQFSFGSDILEFAVPLERPHAWGPLRITTDQIATLLVTVALGLSVHFMLRRSRFGRELRAMADNPTLCEITGVDVDRARLVMWIVAMTLATIGGILFGLNLVIEPDMGAEFLIPIFAAAILGGIGNPYGAMGGALIIGMAQEWSTMVVPSPYKGVISFVIMAGCLLLRPNGLWSRGR